MMHPAPAQVLALAVVVFVYTIAAFGFSYIVGHSTISLPFRKMIEPEKDDTRVWSMAARNIFLALIECPACFGTWIGLALGLFFHTQLGFPGYSVIVPAFYTCGSNFLISKWSGLTQ